MLAVDKGAKAVHKQPAFSAWITYIFMKTLVMEIVIQLIKHLSIPPNPLNVFNVLGAVMSVMRLH